LGVRLRSPAIMSFRMRSCEDPRLHKGRLIGAQDRHELRRQRALRPEPLIATGVAIKRQLERGATVKGKRGSDSGGRKVAAPAPQALAEHDSYTRA
jgi:hypothetical protein